MPDCAVLVVEDDQDSRDAILEVLRFEGYVTEGAANGQEALEILRRGAFSADVILVDLYMPTMNGRDFARALRDEAALSHIPVIICTGDSSKPMPGTFGTLQKPIDIDSLVAVVRRGCGVRGRISA